MIGGSRGYNAAGSSYTAERGAGNYPEPELTGRSLVLLRQGSDGTAAGLETLRNKAGVAAIRSSDARDGASVEDLAPSSAMILDGINVAVVNGDPDQMGRLSIQAERADSILAVEPERVLYIAGDSRFSLCAEEAPNRSGPKSRDYLRGYRDGFNHAAAFCLEDEPLVRSTLGALAASFNESAATWGLQVTGVLNSQFSGAGVRVAVLDTGFTLNHPDFAGRTVVSKSFVQGQTVADGHGHGTHCIGTVAGPRTPNPLPRYGCGYGVEIYAGKVLSNQGSGGDGGILAGIDWAVQNRCRVISMSLGAPTVPGQKPSTVFENVARRALAAGTLIVAAAGNESDRRANPPFIAPVDHPANCPSIMAVAAIDSQFGIAYFSCGSVNPNGGHVDIAGPGVNVYSSWTLPKRYNTISGTSMATPHVAGIAALHIEANPGITAVDLWTRLVKTARHLPQPAGDVGSGLVQAPV